MKKLNLMMLLLSVTLLLCSCADNTNISNCVTLNDDTYGFWGGLWHGMIVTLDFIGMLIWDDVTVYAPNNNGGWYAFGFVLGANGTVGAIVNLLFGSNK